MEASSGVRQPDLFPVASDPRGAFVPALTLWQPWASLIFSGAKLHETRSWPAPPAVIGSRIAIHAAKAPPPRRLIDSALEDLCIRLHGSDWHRILPRGVVLGTCLVAGCHRTETLRDSVDADDLASGVWTNGRWAWLLDSVKTFDDPVPASGLQKLWKWHPNPGPA